MKSIYFLLVCFFLISACQSTRPELRVEQLPLVELVNHNLFTQLDSPKEAELFHLPEKEQVNFLAYVKRKRLEGVTDDRIIYNYLENEIANFTYHGDSLTASQTLVAKQGNCISLALLTQAYANLIELETGFQEMTDDPVYAKDSGIIFASNHFRTMLYRPTKNDVNTIKATRSGLLVDYFSSRSSQFSGTASYNDLVAKYYSNLAADALANTDYNLAYTMLLKANEFTPSSPALFNLAGVLHRRKGDTASAQLIYQNALDSNRDNINLLKNYHLLASETQQYSLLSKLDDRLLLKQSDPYELISLAENKAQQGLFISATELIDQAIIKAPYLSEPYLALAKVKYMQGQLKNTQQLLKQAMDLEIDQSKRKIYQAKLLSLQSK